MSRPRREFVLVVAVIVALVLVALGAGAHGPASVDLHAGRDLVVVVATLAVLGAFGGLVATMNRLNRHRLSRILLGGVVVGCLLAAGVGLSWLFFRYFRAGPAQAPPMPGQPGQGPLLPQRAGQGGGYHAALSPVPIAGGSLVVVLLVAAVLFAVLGRRRRRLAGGIDHEATERGAVYAAVDAGADAMRDVRDPRAAIIACYAAMERVLDAAGVRRLVAETPSDLLARAAELDIAPQAASRLTELFLEARYSTHPMPGADRDAARAALAELRARRGEATKSPNQRAGSGG